MTRKKTVGLIVGILGVVAMHFLYETEGPDVQNAEAIVLLVTLLPSLFGLYLFTDEPFRNISSTRVTAQLFFILWLLIGVHLLLQVYTSLYAGVHPLMFSYLVIPQAIALQMISLMLRENPIPIPFRTVEVYYKEHPYSIPQVSGYRSFPWGRLIEVKSEEDLPPYLKKAANSIFFAPATRRKMVTKISIYYGLFGKKSEVFYRK